MDLFTWTAIQDVALKTSWERWMREKGGGRGSGRSTLVAQHVDDDDDDAKIPNLIFFVNIKLIFIALLSLLSFLFGLCKFSHKFKWKRVSLLQASSDYLSQSQQCWGLVSVNPSQDLQ